MAGVGSTICIYGMCMIPISFSDSSNSLTALAAIPLLIYIASASLSIYGFWGMLEWRKRSPWWSLAALFPMIGHILLAFLLYGRPQREEPVTVYPRHQDEDVVKDKSPFS